jgi:asparagine synthase (glutamine-hydrolysing)
MCGIAGQARADGLIPSGETLSRMCAAIEHRGPDSRGAHLEEGVALGIQRLRVIDLVSGDQPIFNEDRTVAVVLNGEIYNYRELRRELEARGHRFQTRSDTEVIAHLYEELGPGLVRSLHGMFALAVWDARRRRLLLARDRLGKKPLFYAEREGVLSFASELRALLEDGEISREPDVEALDAFLTLGYVPGPRSAFRAVRKLPAAHRLSYEDGRSRLERYWRLDYSPKRKFADERELDEELRAHVRRAVRRRLVSDVPVGAFLSGGIDSAAVVSAMAAESSSPVSTFSIGFGAEDGDELPAARALAERFGTDHHEFVVRPDAIELLPRIVRHHGEPFADVTAIPTFCLAEVTRRHVTVALTGDGGDELFGGYRRYVTNRSLARLDRLPLALRRALSRAGAAIPASGRIESWPSKLGRAAATLPLAAPDRYLAYVSQLDGLRPRDLYTDSRRESLDATPARDEILRAWQAAPASELVDRMLSTDLQTYLPDDLLAKADIASMASSLELRCPLLDHELVEFAATLPSSEKIDGSETKRALRRMLRGTVPDELLHAPKQGFHPPLASWLRGELAGHARELLLDGPARGRGHFDPARVAALLDGHARGARDASALIWRLMVWETWHREFVDDAAPRSPVPAPPLAATAER